MSTDAPHIGPHAPSPPHKRTSLNSDARQAFFADFRGWNITFESPWDGPARETHAARASTFLTTCPAALTVVCMFVAALAPAVPDDATCQTPRTLDPRLSRDATTPGSVKDLFDLPSTCSGLPTRFFEVSEAAALGAAAAGTSPSSSFVRGGTRVKLSVRTTHFRHTHTQAPLCPSLKIHLARRRTLAPPRAPRAPRNPSPRAPSLGIAAVEYPSPVLMHPPRQRDARSAPCTESTAASDGEVSACSSSSGTLATSHRQEGMKGAGSSQSIVGARSTG
ncbi:hypothetical protein BKA93DRAFT_828011 [Sparassis latifolia]